MLLWYKTSQRHEIFCHDSEVMGSNSDGIKLRDALICLSQTMVLSHRFEMRPGFSSTSYDVKTNEGDMLMTS